MWSIAAAAKLVSFGDLKASFCAFYLQMPSQSGNIQTLRPSQTSDIRFAHSILLHFTPFHSYISLLSFVLTPLTTQTKMDYERLGYFYIMGTRYTQITENTFLK